MTDQTTQITNILMHWGVPEAQARGHAARLERWALNQGNDPASAERPNPSALDAVASALVGEYEPINRRIDSPITRRAVMERAKFRSPAPSASSIVLATIEIILGADPNESEAIRHALAGEMEPLARFGVAIFDVPWWRRRIQRYLSPSRFRRWAQQQILRASEEE